MIWVTQIVALSKVHKFPWNYKTIGTGSEGIGKGDTVSSGTPYGMSTVDYHSKPATSWVRITGVVHYYDAIKLLLYYHTWLAK